MYRSDSVVVSFPHNKVTPVETHIQPVWLMYKALNRVDNNRNHPTGIQLCVSIVPCFFFFYGAITASAPSSKG